jgi:hypothetical protein
VGPADRVPLVHVVPATDVTGENSPADDVAWYTV